MKERLRNEIDKSTLKVIITTLIENGHVTGSYDGEGNLQINFTIDKKPHEKTVNERLHDEYV
jgi:hypothetical protein